MTNHKTQSFFFFLLKHSSDVAIENDKCIFMLIMVMWITPHKWHNNNAKIHQNEGCLSFSKT